MSDFQQAVRLLPVAQYIDELHMSLKYLPPTHLEVLERRLADAHLTTAPDTLMAVIDELAELSAPAHTAPAG